MLFFSVVVLVLLLMLLLEYIFEKDDQIAHG